MCKLSLVIPCYNEARNLPKLLARAAESFTRADVELILVDNGSKDNTPEVLRELLPRYPFARSIRVPENVGYGHGILQGLDAARGEYIGWTHADLQTDPADAIRALEVIDQNSRPIYVKGLRHSRKWGDLFFTYGMEWVCSRMLRIKLNDINAQPNIFPRAWQATWDNPPHDFALDLYAYARALNEKLDVRRINVLFPERMAGEAHLRNIKAKMRYAYRMLKYTWACTH